MTAQSGPGRRRSFEDEQAFQHITQLLLDNGMASLSMPTLARRLGITHQSLGNRFSSRGQMLQAYFAWMSLLYQDQFEGAIAHTTSPLERLWRLLILPMDERITGREPGTPAQWIRLSLELFRDPGLTESLVAGQQALGLRMVEAIEESVRTGLLRECDPVDLADLLYSAALGGAVNWLLVGKSNDTHIMERTCFYVLQPYLVNPVELPAIWMTK